MSSLGIRCVDCRRPVHRERGGAWCEEHTPVDLTDLPVPRAAWTKAKSFARLVTNEALATAVRDAEGNITQAAERLGISRQAVSERMRRDPALRALVAGGAR